MRRVRALRGGAVLVPAMLVVLAACGSGEPSSRSASRSPTTETAASSPSSGLVDADLGATMGALDTMLHYCMPGLPGSPRESCDLRRLMNGLTEITATLTRRLGSGSARARYPDAPAAISALDASVNAMNECQEWYEGERSLVCGQKWDTMLANWQTLKKAAHWPRPSPRE
jgi:hypothetical protein